MTPVEPLSPPGEEEPHRPRAASAGAPPTARQPPDPSHQVSPHHPGPAPLQPRPAHPALGPPRKRPAPPHPGSAPPRPRPAPPQAHPTPSRPARPGPINRSALCPAVLLSLCPNCSAQNETLQDSLHFKPCTDLQSECSYSVQNRTAILSRVLRANSGAHARASAQSGGGSGVPKATLAARWDTALSRFGAVAVSDDGEVSVAGHDGT